MGVAPSDLPVYHHMSLDHAPFLLHEGVDGSGTHDTVERLAGAISG